MNRKLFCSFKGYGDFVVTARFLRDMPKGRYRLLCARHLEPLYRAIGCPVEAKWVELTDDGKLPAAYDIRQQGAAAAARSIFRIRRAIRQNLDADEDLFFEYLTARERLMAWPRYCEQVGRITPNIYKSYTRHFGCEAKNGDRLLRGPVKRVAIFPDARLPHRVLGTQLLGLIGDECARRQLDVRAIRVGSGHAESGGVPVEWINGFDALVAAIRSADVVVSSDSLPGHVAEYFGVPVFVFVPWRKDYWMPGSAFERGGFALFTEPTVFGSWLTRLSSEPSVSAGPDRSTPL